MQTDYLGRLVQLIEGLASTQAQAFEVGARRAADAVEGGGFIHLYGSGHSVIPVMEAFPRYGAFAALNPLTDPLLMWWDVLGSGGVRELLWLERTEGYVQQYLNNQPISSGDAMIVVSHGGRNAAPIEAAIYGRDRGAFVIGVTSIANAARPREHSSGKHLSEVVDLVLDTGVPVEDALEPAVEEYLRTCAEEPVALRRVRHVLERLAEPSELRDQLLRLLRVHALVALAVGYEQRDVDAVQSVHRRAVAVLIA